MEDGLADVQSGPAAVMRNLTALCGEKNDEWRLVIMDRFYTSVPLALQMLSNKFYTLGTIMTNRLGFPKNVIDKRKTRPKNVSRGDYRAVKSKYVSNMYAFVWWDNKPVHMLCTGSSMAEDEVTRREKSGAVAKVPCPRPVLDYNKGMGGVDVHDQLRLQRYAIY